MSANPETRSFLQQLLTQNQIKTVAKMNVWELVGFVYYKIGRIFQILHATVMARTFIPLKKLSVAL